MFVCKCNISLKRINYLHLTETQVLCQQLVNYKEQLSDSKGKLKDTRTQNVNVSYNVVKSAEKIITFKFDKLNCPKSY